LTQHRPSPTHDDHLRSAATVRHVRCSASGRFEQEHAP
jgi:hypothetical protein